MTLSDKAEEILESLWTEQSEKGRAAVDFKALGPARNKAGVEELLKAGLIESHDGEVLTLTPAGQERGREVVRCHRLAERLMVDVLAMSEASGDAAACRFEHVLKRGIDERICAILGHPRFCPHGLPIPPGACCKEHLDASMRIVSPLSEMEEGEKGYIAYLHTGQKGRLERLLALGVLPGQPIVLIQRFPSYVFRVGETQIAVDTDLASNIYVRLGNKPPARRRWRRRTLFR